jgi:hypothetical protein
MNNIHEKNHIHRVLRVGGAAVAVALAVGPLAFDGGRSSYPGRFAVPRPVAATIGPDTPWGNLSSTMGR